MKTAPLDSVDFAIAVAIGLFVFVMTALVGSFYEWPYIVSTSLLISICFACISLYLFRATEPVEEKESYDDWMGI